MKKTEINLFTQGIKLKIKNSEKFIDWIIKTIKEENKYAGEINFIYCNDKYLININKKYLDHDYYTDIITFDNSDEKDEISGDIFISYERVKENAEKLLECIDNEICRVSIHGILHLIGYNDSKKEEIEMMREKEEHYISRKSFKII